MRFIYDVLRRSSPQSESRTTVCELGFNAGHSALLFLESLPQARVYSFDLCDGPWTLRNADRMAALYPDRFELIIGDSADTVPAFLSRGIECDVVFVDGSKEAPHRRKDMALFRSFARKDAVVFLDEISSAACMRGTSPCEGDYAAISEMYLSLVRDGQLYILDCVDTVTPNDSFCSARFHALKPDGMQSDLPWRHGASETAKASSVPQVPPLSSGAESGLPYVSTKLHSGLGNQLFQLARAFGYAERHGGVPGVWVRGAELNPHSVREGTNYFRTIFARLTRIDTPPDRIWEEPADATNAYVEGPTLEPHLRHVHFRGYFQHERYFPRDWHGFLSALQLPSVAPMARTAFIHVRRGDYVGCPQHDIGLVESGYYATAIALIREHHSGNGAVRFLVFSDDIQWSKASALFAGPDFEFSEETDEVVALMTMAACELGGVAVNSSFSWWGAYLNGGANKTGVFPDRWYTERSGRVSDSQFAGSYVVHLGAGNAVRRLVA